MFLLFLTTPNHILPHPPCSKITQLCQLLSPKYSISLSISIHSRYYCHILGLNHMTKASWSSSLDSGCSPIHPLLSGQNREIYIKCQFVCVTAMLTTFWGRPNNYRISVQFYHNKCLHLFLFLFIPLVSTHHYLFCSTNIKWGKVHHPYHIFSQLHAFSAQILFLLFSSNNPYSLFCYYMTCVFLKITMLSKSAQ